MKPKNKPDWDAHYHVYLEIYTKCDRLELLGLIKNFENINMRFSGTELDAKMTAFAISAVANSTDLRQASEWVQRIAELDYPRGGKFEVFMKDPVKRLFHRYKGSILSKELDTGWCCATIPVEFPNGDESMEALKEYLFEEGHFSLLDSETLVMLENRKASLIPEVLPASILAR